jgi:membrane associated rhomboid family serine protease
MAFLVSEPQREPMFRVPTAVLWLIGLLAAAHVARLLVPADISEEMLIRFAFVPLRYTPGIDGGSLLDKAMPFIGHQFLHADFLHLGMNCVWLLACGPAVARRYGTWPFFIFFLLCGIAGAAAFLALDWRGLDGAIGASGAVSGLMAASVRMIPWQGDPWRAFSTNFPLVPLFSKPVMWFSLIWFVTNLIFGVTGFGAGEGIHQIAWQAHLGGFVAGLLLPDAFDMGCRRFGHRNL